MCADGPLWLGTAVRKTGHIGTSTRIGITREVDRLLRFFEWEAPSLAAQEPSRRNEKAAPIAIRGGFAWKRPKIPICGYEFLETECPIQSTWIGQDPNFSTTKPHELLSPVDASLSKNSCKGRFTRNARYRGR